MTRICFYKLFLINKNKNTEYLNNDYANIIKFEDYIKFERNRQKTQKRAERQKKLVFQNNQ